MKILIVIDQYDGANNGTTISARRFVENLRKRGNDVRVISTGKEEDGKYAVDNIHLIPVVNWIVTSQGMEFAKADEEKLKEAINWAEVVHFYMPFFLSIKGMKIAKEMNKPMTAAFHVQPENITYSIGLGKSERVNDKIYTVFRDCFFNEFHHIHCPSNFIANELKEHGYTAKLHVISNGIEDDWKYRKTEKQSRKTGCADYGPETNSGAGARADENTGAEKIADTQQSGNTNRQSQTKSGKAGVSGQ